MHDEEIETEQFRPFQFIGEGVDGFLEQFLLGGGEIDQV